MVMLFNRPADAVRLSRLEAKSSLGTLRRGSLVLLYDRLTARAAKLRSAFAASG
jgi:hypothetical protein